MTTKYEPTEQTLKMIEEAFTFHPVHGDQAERYTAIRAKAKEFALFVAENTPHSREQTLSLREIQLAVMLANAAIAINEADE